MQISGIGTGGLGIPGGLSGLNGDLGVSQAAGAPVNPGSEVGSAFEEMLASLSGASAEADTAVVDLATGGDRDLHDVVLAVEMESLAFDLAVQIRNRLVEAYSEVFRMQV